MDGKRRESLPLFEIVKIIHAKQTKNNNKTNNRKQQTQLIESVSFRKVVDSNSKNFYVYLKIWKLSLNLHWLNQIILP